MLRYVKLAIEHAQKTKADYVIIEWTPMRCAYRCKEIVDLIMNFKKPIWVFINSDAASAGALISIACDSIICRPGQALVRPPWWKAMQSGTRQIPIVYALDHALDSEEITAIRVLLKAWWTSAWWWTVSSKPAK